MAAVVFFGRDLIRTAGLDTFGAWSMISFLGGLYSLADFGFARESILRISTAHDSASRATHVLRLAWFSLFGAILTAVVSLAALGAGLGGSASTVRQHLGAVSIGVVLSSLSLAALSLVRTLSEAANGITRVNYSFLAQTVLSYAFAATAARLFPGHSVIFLTYPAALLAVLLPFLPIATAAFREAAPYRRPTARDVASTWAAGAGHGVAGALSYSILPLNRTFILSHENSLSIFAVFEVISKIAEAAGAFLTASFTPLYRHFLGQRSPKEQWHLVGACERLAALGLVLGSGLYAAVARPALFYLIGEASRPFVCLSVIMVTLRASHGLAEPTTRLLWAYGNKRVVLGGRISGALLNVLLLGSLGFFLDIAWTSAIAYSVPFLASAIFIRFGAKMVIKDSSDMGASP